jgi:hypothetical protein
VQEVALATANETNEGNWLRFALMFVCCVSGLTSQEEHDTNVGTSTDRADALVDNTS